MQSVVLLWCLIRKKHKWHFSSLKVSLSNNTFQLVRSFFSFHVEMIFLISRIKHGFNKAKHNYLLKFNDQRFWEPLPFAAAKVDGKKWPKNLPIFGFCVKLSPLFRKNVYLLEEYCLIGGQPYRINIYHITTV